MDIYLTVGTNEIKKDLFRMIKDSKDNDNIKPNGGLWLSEFDISCPNFNIWVENLLIKPYILFYKNINYDPFLLPCSLVKLDDRAKIFVLDSYDKYGYLVSKFSNSRGGFSFAWLSKYYDGIFVNVKNMQFLDDGIGKKFSKFDVNSLILFNCDVIDFYYSGVVDIEYFDYEYMPYGEINYLIKWDNEKKYIKSRKK